MGLSGAVRIVAPLLLFCVKDTPRRNWERIALMADDALADSPRNWAKRSPAPDTVAVHTAPAQFTASAN